jgi:glycosyltransferase involved in cell wall biosynthesis
MRTSRCCVAIARELLRPVRRALVRRRIGTRAPHTWLFPVGNARWVLDEEARAVGDVARRLGMRVGPVRWAGHVERQCVFHFNRFALLREPWTRTDNRLAVAYYHGRPGTPGYPEFDATYRVLSEYHADLSRIRVSNRAMLNLVLESGIEQDKVHLIPIGLEADLFRPASHAEREAAREAMGIPSGAFVVGSLQKDGVGMGEGNEPKLVKGPDVLVAALRALHLEASDLFVLLTGPARGYVRTALERAGIPYRHMAFDDYARLPEVYRVLDACLIASRQEGGPKALLEAMASGVPVVSTRTGQAADLVRDGENGLLADVEDSDALAAGLLRVHDGGAWLGPLREAAAKTAAVNSYDAQIPLWRRFFDGFVERP